VKLSALLFNFFRPIPSIYPDLSIRRKAIAAERLVVFPILAVVVDYGNHCLVFSNLLLSLSPLDATVDVSR